MRALKHLGELVDKMDLPVTTQAHEGIETQAV